MRKCPLVVPGLLLACLVFVALAGPAFAGVSGKVSGMVRDASTGQPVVGATVRVLGTNLVTKTDEDGEYFIISVPSGKYDVTVTSVGHEPTTKKEVRVLVDLTTPLDFDLEEELVELDEQVVVYAERPVVQKDLTASTIIFDSDRLSTLPNVQSVQSVLTNYPGVVIGADNSMHVRGGRSGQVTYYLDGFSVQDPFVANAGIRIMPSALEELSLMSGGFTAEYGEALSGVVNAVTPEGTSEYRGKLRYFEGMTHPYDVTSGTWGGLQTVDNRSMSFSLSGPLPGFDAKRYTFFSAGEVLADPGYLPHDDFNSYSGILKLSFQPIAGMKFKTLGNYYSASGEIYDHRDVNGVSYDFNLDGLPVFERESYLFGLSNNYAVNEKTIITGSWNHFFTKTKTAPEHLMDQHWSAWPGYSVDAEGNYNGTIDDDNYLSVGEQSDPIYSTGFTVGDDFEPTYHRRTSAYNSWNLALLTQVNKSNAIKAGLEYRQYAIDWDFIQFYNTSPYGERYTSKPKIASAFIQDKLEYDYFVINMGLRYDYYNSDIEYNSTPQDPTPTYSEADARSRVSPRLGVSFPVSERTVMHFNYGFYHQIPQFQYLYTNLDGDVESGYPLLGNPNLEPEETVSYELGVDHVIGDDIRLDVTAYYKDIKDLVTTRSSFTWGGNPVTEFTNDDYGSVKGFDVALEKLPGPGYLTGSVSYSYMQAYGNGSGAYEPYYTYITSPESHDEPLTEYPLDFDQRHTVRAIVNYNVPADWQGNLLGMKIPGAWGFNVVGHYGSGLPYTKTDVDGNPLGNRNEGRLPANYTVDMRFHKDFWFSNARYAMTFFVEVDNLFNRRNVISVYSLTGRADDDGYSRTASGSESQAELDFYDDLYDRDPQNYSSPRTVRTGLEITF